MRGNVGSKFVRRAKTTLSCGLAELLYYKITFKAIVRDRMKNLCMFRH